MAAISATTLAITAMATSVVGMGVQLYSQKKQRDATRRVTEFNAKVAENEAINTDLEARENIRRKRKENRRTLAAQRSKVGPMGVTFEGSPLEQLGESAANLELEVFDLSRAAENRIRSLTSKAEQTRIAGKEQIDALRLKSVSTILNTGTSLMGSAAGYRHQGII